MKSEYQTKASIKIQLHQLSKINMRLKAKNVVLTKIHI